MDGPSRRLPGWLFVVGIFLAGWLLGAAGVLRAWAVARQLGLPMTTGWGYVSFMMAPLTAGVLLAGMAARLLARGWSWPSVRWTVVGVTCACIGLLSV